MIGSFLNRRLALPALLTLSLAGCDTGFGASDAQSVSLSFTTPRGAARASSAISADVITGGGSTLDLQRVDVSFAEIVLERAEGGFGGDSDGDSEKDSDSSGPGNEKFRSGFVTVQLPLNGGVVTPITQALPVGVYEELEADVSQVRIVGTYNGAAFDVTLPVDAELEMAFNPPFEVKTDADRLNITVSFDAHQWFRNSDGTLVDPRAVAASRDLRERLVRRIESSFRAFEDSDRDADDSDSDSDSR